MIDMSDYLTPDTFPDEDDSRTWPVEDEADRESLDAMVERLVAEDEWRGVNVKRCPDDGACHHGCVGDYCFRVEFCEPLSGVFPEDRWP